MARAEEMLAGEKNTFFELSSPRFFKGFKVRVPFASNRASVGVSPGGLVMPPEQRQELPCS